jgi:hypothetical protein
MNPFKIAVAALGAAFALSAISASAQPRHPVKWASSPEIHIVNDSFRHAPAVFILDESVSQTQRGDDGDYIQYYTTHRIIHLNDDLGAEAFNTFHVPLAPGMTLYEIKARTILPGGRVVKVAREKIRQVKADDGSKEYLVAMEAVTPDAEVELLYTMILPGTAADYEIFQHRVPVQQAVFRLIGPEPMVYDCKGYNGFPNPVDSSLGDQRCYTAIARNIPALEDEARSRYKAALQRVDYKLSYVLRTEREKERRQTWNDMAKGLQERYIRLGSRELRAADRLVQKMNLKAAGPEEQKIIAIEDYLKSNVALSDEVPDDDDGFELATRRKLASEKGMVRLFAACLQSQGIRYEVGKVGSRFSFGMDDSLEMWSHLSEYVLYLPAQDAYLVPAAAIGRYPFVPYELCGSKGVFTKAGSSGQSAKADLRVIPHSAAAQNAISLVSTVSFEGKDLQPQVRANWSFKGQSGGDLLPLLLYLPKDKEREAITALIGLNDRPEDMERFAIENVSPKIYTSGQPVELSATMRAPRLMEKAGPKYLFRVGELIGKQMDLYAEKKRSLPVEIDYPNEQLRTLRISIPTGYRVANPEVLRMNAQCQEAGKQACVFSSDYRVEGSELIVSVRETYLQTTYPLSLYPDYRKVVNAAADFSKAVIVLQKI